LHSFVTPFLKKKKTDFYKDKFDSRAVNIVSPSVLRGFYGREKSPQTFVDKAPSTLSDGEVAFVNSQQPEAYVALLPFRREKNQ
jgi:hypothetical protein